MQFRILSLPSSYVSPYKSICLSYIDYVLIVCYLCHKAKKKFCRFFLKCGVMFCSSQLLWQSFYFLRRCSSSCILVEHCRLYFLPTPSLLSFLSEYSFSKCSDPMCVFHLSFSFFCFYFSLSFFPSLYILGEHRKHISIAFVHARY